MVFKCKKKWKIYPKYNIENSPREEKVSIMLQKEIPARLQAIFDHLNAFIYDNQMVWHNFSRIIYIKNWFREFEKSCKIKKNGMNWRQKISGFFEIYSIFSLQFTIHFSFFVSLIFLKKFLLLCLSISLRSNIINRIFD